MLRSLTSGNSAELNKKLLPVLVAGAVLFLAAYLGMRARLLWAILPIALGAGIVLLRHPVLGLPLLIYAALLLPLNVDTGTEVFLNPASLLVPSLLALWILGMLLRRNFSLTATKANQPMLLFLLVGLFSLVLGRATWDPQIPVSTNFILVQLGQWSIFAFSAGAFWLTANLVKDVRWLQRLTATFLLLAGGVAILHSLPGVDNVLNSFMTVAFIRAPLWTLLAALAGGQLLFNQELTYPWRLFLVAALVAALVYTFITQQETASNWVGLMAVLGTLVWLRYPRLRRAALALLVLLVVSGFLLPAIYQFAGGDDEWTESGGSRLVLAERVIEVSLRNPVTGLGPAAYRPYANSRPLVYEHIFWANPVVSSHNNYVDLFAHVGLLGLGLFFWFAVEVARLGMRLRERYEQGFAAGYVNGTLAAGAAALILMLFADWILPFVYNIGFPGFQASVLVWLFLGGLVALDHISQIEIEAEETA